MTSLPTTTYPRLVAPRYRYMAEPAVAVEVPPGVVTVTATVANGPAGTVAVIVVEFSIVYEVAGVEPNTTSVAPTSAFPEMVTVPPPVGSPAFGEIAVTAGTGAYVNRSPGPVAEV